MSETVILAAIGILGGAGGLFTLVKAFLDVRDNKHARESDAEERLVARLERRLDGADERASGLERRLARAERRNHVLTLALVRAGVEIPPE